MNNLQNTQFRKNSKRYHSYYINRFISLRCSVDMLQLGLFPNAKEITESFAALEAVNHLPYDWKDPDVHVICVGDGLTPRTAATFAFMTKWTCISVDPLLKGKWEIDRLTAHPNKIEDMCCSTNKPTIVVCVHSHASLQSCMQSIHSPYISIVAIPCCQPLYLNQQPDMEYVDGDMWSPQNTVKIWRNVSSAV
jgi:hypothetical protein